MVLEDVLFIDVSLQRFPLCSLSSARDHINDPEECDVADVVRKSKGQFWIFG